MSEKHPALFVIFGGSGDLAHRKLYPSLFQLFLKGHLNHQFAVIGTARRTWTDDYFRSTVLDNLTSGTSEQQQEFASHFYYQSHDVQDAAHYVILKRLIDRLDQEYELQGNRLFYMAMAPALFGTIADHLKSEHLLSDDGYNRLIIEKPFGHDFESAFALNQAIMSTFDHDQVFRIDHYLGKEMIQEIPYLRFSNPILSRVWNRESIDNIQITLAEQLGVEERAGYYETAGALRDMVQNHIMQIIAMLTFPQPDHFSDHDLEVTKGAVFNHLQQLSQTEVATKFIRGQYGPSKDGKMVGYRQEEKTDKDSRTETFVAGEIQLDLPEWQGVPFFVRTGKRLVAKKTRIDIVFKPAQTQLFGDDSLAAPVLTIEVEPDAQIHLTLNSKEVGAATSVSTINLDYLMNAEDKKHVPDAYERLLLEAILGHQRNFVHWHDMANAWHFVDEIRLAWEKCDCPAFPNYSAGSMGPTAATELLTNQNRAWIYNGQN